jgi:D-glycero-D-manno-heptose 1,7-bisphosphate phosphatase
MPDVVTLRQCVIDGPMDPAMLAARMREMLRFGVRQIVVPPALLAAATAASAALPIDMRVSRADDGLEPRFLRCEGPSLFTGNLAPLLRDFAGDQCSVPVRRLVDEAGRPTGIMTCRGGVSDAQDAPVTYATGCAAPVPRRGLFLDRDGVLNIDHGYVGTTARWEWVPGALDAVRMATDAGWHVFVVTNQSGIARGLYTEDDAKIMLDWMADGARRHGGTIDDYRYCPTHPQAKLPAYRRESDWRKPAPGMLLSLMAAWALDPAHCLMVGDQETDRQAGQAAGMPAHIFPGGDLAQFLAPLLAPNARMRGAARS